MMNLGSPDYYYHRYGDTFTSSAEMDQHHDEPDQSANLSIPEPSSYFQGQDYEVMHEEIAHIEFADVEQTDQYWVNIGTVITNPGNQYWDSAEMITPKLEDSETYICTSCFIALRTAYEFKQMCQATEQKFQSHNFKYRRPFGVGPGSAQFHVALNEITNDSSTNTSFRNQNLNYLQADTSIDITEHHLYDASRISRQQLSTNIINNVTQKLPEIDMEVVIPEKNAENKIGAKKLDSLELRKKYNIGSEISILKNDKNEITLKRQPFKLMAYLKENNINPNALNCNIRLRLMTSNYVRCKTKGKYSSLKELRVGANSYFFNKLEQYIPCRFCYKTFSTRFGLQMHEEAHFPTKHFTCSHCDAQFLLKDSLRRHLFEYHKISPPVPLALKIKQEIKLPELTAEKPEEEEAIKISDQATLIRIKREQTHTNYEKKHSSGPVETKPQISIKPRFPEKMEKKIICKSEIIDKFDCSTFAEQLGNSIKQHIIKVDKPAEKVIIKQEFIKPLYTSTPITKKTIKEIKDSKPKTDVKSITAEKLKFENIKYYRCLICHKYCRNKMQLIKHQSFSHIPNTSSKYWSNIIAKTILERKANRNYSLRLRTRQPDYITPFRCNICDKRFADENFLNLHLHCHIPVVFSLESVSGAEDGPEVFICYLCSKGFPRERYLKLHNLQVHLCKTTTCKTCRREFKSEFWFNRHRCQSTVENAIVVDEKRGPFICKLCNRGFAKIRFMKSHCRRVHPEVNDLKQLIRFKTPKDGDIDLNDPMQLYAIAGKAISKGNDKVADASTDDSSNDSVANADEGEIEDDDFADSKAELQALIKDSSRDDNSVKNPFAINTRRKSIQRSIPKIQCDFCGEYIEENIYDNHIYEHNKIRFKKIPRKLEVDDESTLEDILDKNKVTMKCHICYKTFQRKYYLISHINKHLKEEPYLNDTENTPESDLNDTSQMEDEDNSENEDDEEEDDEEEGGEGRPLKPYEINLQIANTSDVYKCCDKTFKLKAHFFRHYKMRHGAYKLTNPCSKLARIKKEYSDELNEENKSRYFTRKGTPKHYDEQKFEEESVRSIKKEPSMVNSNKRKSEDRDEINEEVKKSRIEEIQNPETEVDSESEFVRHKRIKSEAEATTEATTSQSDRQMNTSSPTSELDMMQLEQNKLTFRYQCLICDKKFKQKCQLRDHSNVHTGAKPYICEFCAPPRGFTQTSSLYVHFRRVHSDIVKNCVWEVYSKNGACLICSEIFEKHAVMFRHVKDQYMEKAFKCHVCLKECNMVCHYKIHDINPDEMRLILMQANQADEEEEVEVEPDVDPDLDPEEEPESEEYMDEEDESFDIAKESVDTAKFTSTPVEETHDSEMDTLENQEQIEKVKKGVECVECNRTFTHKQQLKFHRKSLAHIQRVQSLKKQEDPDNDNEDENIMDPSKHLDTIADIKNNVKAMMEKINNMKYRKNHQCPTCGESFNKKIQLKKHKRKMHRVITRRNKKNEEDEDEDEFNPEVDDMSNPEDSSLKSLDEDPERSNESFATTENNQTGSPSLPMDVNNEEKNVGVTTENDQTCLPISPMHVNDEEERPKDIAKDNRINLPSSQMDVNDEEKDPKEITKDNQSCSLMDINDEEKNSEATKDNQASLPSSPIDTNNEEKVSNADNIPSITSESVHKVDTDCVTEKTGDDNETTVMVNDQECSSQKTLENKDDDQISENFDDEQNFNLSVASDLLNNSCEMIPQITEPDLVDTPSVNIKSDDKFSKDKLTLNREHFLENEVEEKEPMVNCHDDDKAIDSSKDVNQHQDHDEDNSTKLNHCSVFSNFSMQDTNIDNGSDNSPISNTEVLKISKDELAESTNVNNLPETVMEDCRTNIKDDLTNIQSDLTTKTASFDDTIIRANPIELQNISNTSNKGYSNASTDFGLDNISTDVSPNICNPNYCTLKNDKEDTNLLNVSSANFNCINETTDEEKDIILEKGMSKIESLESIRVEDI